MFFLCFSNYTQKFKIFKVSNNLPAVKNVSEVDEFVKIQASQGVYPKPKKTKQNMASGPRGKKVWRSLPQTLPKFHWTETQDKRFLRGKKRAVFNNSIKTINTVQREK